MPQLQIMRTLPQTSLRSREDIRSGQDAINSIDRAGGHPSFYRTHAHPALTPDVVDTLNHGRSSVEWQERSGSAIDAHFRRRHEVSRYHGAIRARRIGAVVVSFLDHKGVGAVSPEARQEHQGKPRIPAFAQAVNISAACACAYVRLRQKRLHMKHVFGRVFADHPVRSHNVYPPCGSLNSPRKTNHRKTAYARTGECSGGNPFSSRSSCPTCKT